MSIFRLHTLRIPLVVLITLSVLSFLFHDQKSVKQEDKVVNWLQSLMLEQHDAEVNSKLASLSYQGSDTSDFLKEATQIIRDHSDHFKLPIDSSQSSDEEIYQLLLVEWTEFQQTNSGMNATTNVDRSSKNGFYLEKYFKTASDAVKDFSKTTHTIYTTSLDVIQFIRHNILPLIGGTAIGAP